MRLIKSKDCIVCGKVYQPTGSCSKYCSSDCKASVWTQEVKSKATYDWQVKKGIIKQPGVGTGHGQESGPEHHSYKPDAPHRYRDFIKDVCEKCGSKKFLCGHHRDQDRSSNVESNIQTLCKKCHQKEHKTHLNFLVGLDDVRRAKLAANMTKLNKTLPRKNGKNNGN